MKVKLFIMCIILCFVQRICAQSEFRQGYIIHNSGDTLFGEIDYREASIMSTVCKFRKNDIAAISEFTPLGILSYRFTESKYYVSKSIKTTLGERKVFLEYLIKGKLNVYYYFDGLTDHYYIQKEEGDLTELKYEAGKKFKDGHDYFYESTTHIGILKYYLKDAPDLISQIEDIEKPEHKNLIKLTESYQNEVCKDEKCIVYEKKMPPLKIAAEAVVGFMRFYESNSTALQLGMNIYFWMPQVNERLFFKTGLLYARAEETNYYFNGENENLRMVIYQIPLQIQYIYTKFKIKPKLNCGFNIYSAGDYYGYALFHSLQAGGGFNYNFYKGISLSINISSEFTPIMYTIDNSFTLVAYSANVGIYYSF